MHRIATLEDLEALWNRNIAENPGDDRWLRWKQEYIGYNEAGQAVTFAVICDKEPVGEGTLLLSPECSAIGGRTDLADGKTVANINALRIRKAYEGLGHISAMVKAMEDYAKSRGIQTLTIGVEPCESRNLGIYLHWGYDTLVRWEVEDGAPVLYYKKQLW